jgi:putative photosynthetic complex assembly protein
MTPAQPASSDPEQRVWFPRGALFGAAALVLFSLSVVAIERVTASGSAASRMPELTEARVLWFLDQEGEVVVIDTLTDEQIARFKSGTNGFARGLLRGLARDRRLRDADLAAPFLLGFNSQDRLTLRDPETRTDIVLDAFGSTNRDVFSRLHESYERLEKGAAPAYVTVAANKEKNQ